MLRQLVAVEAIILLQLLKAGSISKNPLGNLVSNINASVPSNLCGFNSGLLAISKASTSAPCGNIGRRHDLDFVLVDLAAKIVRLTN